jgi:cell division septum initiation protein DivIVA
LESEQDWIHVELPRATVGGLKKGPVESLLRRLAHDYSVLEQQNRELLDSLREREGDTDAGVHLSPSLVDSERATEATTPQLDAGHGTPSDGYDLAGAVLNVAQRAAREMRDSTRAECELMIRKSRAHADRIESEVERARLRGMAELDELEDLKRELREELRRSLRAFLRTYMAERSGDSPPMDWRGIVSATEEGRPEKRRNKKKAGGKPPLDGRQTGI